MNEKQQMFANRVKKVYKHRLKQAQRQSITCFRIYDNDLPEFPFCIDRYEDKFYVAEYRRNHGMDEYAHDAWLKDSMDTLSICLNCSLQNIFLKERKVIESRQEQYEKTDGKNEFFVVKENNLSFLINLTDYLDTGLFLDHRITRKLVMEQSHNKRVLNLFSYTGSFSVYAAFGGASLVKSIDLSNTYNDWAEKNLRLNGFVDNERFMIVNGDVMAVLKEVKEKSFDLVLIDPPTFSNSKKMKSHFEVQEDHVFLINEGLRVLTEDGLLYFSTNFSKFKLDFPSINSEKIEDITKKTTPFDFEGKLKRYCYLIKK